MRAVAVVALVACAAFALGCGSPGGVANCPAVSQVCPSPAPTFSGQAQAIIRSTCLPACHEPGGIEANRPMQTYAQISALSRDILSQIDQCRMPILADGTPTSFASPEDKDTLIAWLVCGAMDN
ncbi:MAG TPA: hypothetical protein VH560_10835 [Polyangia bacterium]|nr:hypothetical protein [Polyangia bacterium]